MPSPHNLKGRRSFEILFRLRTTGISLPLELTLDPAMGIESDACRAGDCQDVRHDRYLTLRAPKTWSAIIAPRRRDLHRPMHSLHDLGRNAEGLEIIFGRVDIDG